MDVSIVSREPLKLVALKVVGRRSELSHRVPMAWIELVNRLGQIPHRVENGVFYGAFPESDHLNDGSHGVYTYFVATEVSAPGAVSEGFSELTIPAQRCATTRVQGGPEAIDAAYMGLSRWLGEQGLKSDPNAWGLERYDERLQQVTPPYERFDYEIFTPVR